MNNFNKRIELGNISDAYTDIYDADKMITSCNPKIIDVLCRLSIFTDKNKLSQSHDFSVIYKEAKRIKEEFIDNCII